MTVYASAKMNNFINSWIKSISFNKYPEYILDDKKREKRVTALEQSAVFDVIYFILIIIFFGFLFFSSFEMSFWMLACPAVLILFETVFYRMRRMELMFLKTVSLLKKGNVSNSQTSKITIGLDDKTVKDTPVPSSN
jgi:hypothetical protein